MKKLLSPLILSLVMTGSFAQVPEGFNYQAVARDSNGNVRSNEFIDVRFTLQEGPAGSDPITWIETHHVSTDAFGVFTAIIGTGTKTGGLAAKFSELDFTKGNYWILVEVKDGSNWETVSTLQKLWAVPYAMHSKTAESIKGGITESDPVFGASVAAGITGTDTANWNKNNNTLTKGTKPGEILYWDGKAWVALPPGTTGKTLTFCDSVPHWGPCPSSWAAGTVHCSGNLTAIVDVINPVTGKTWMDRNLGASRAATSSTDTSAYGDLYQWGRRADGHQCSYSSTTTTLSSIDTPAHGKFIISPNSPNDWRSPQNNNLWQGVNGVNNPCPNGYRIPTEAEWEAERLSWSSNNAAGAFTSKLKLPMAGGSLGSSGSLYGVDTYGFYWSSTVSSTLASYLRFYSTDALMDDNSRANGKSVRCIKDY